MPELPEVETIVRELRPGLVGRRITSVRIGKKNLRKPWKKRWAPELVGKKIEAVDRRGKWILVRLENDAYLVFHLGMTGQLTIVPTGQSRALHTHMTMDLGEIRNQESGVRCQGSPVRRECSGVAYGRHALNEGKGVDRWPKPPRPSKTQGVPPGLTPDPCALTPDPEDFQLRFRDIRRFGSVTLFVNDADLQSFFKSAGLGPEPFDLQPRYWQDCLARTGRCLKAVLLDQRVLAGVGNIYADEALFEARMHPRRLGRSVRPEEAGRLRRAIATVLNRAIDKRGSSIRDYVDGSGRQGEYQNEFRVYGRAGEPCVRCGQRIRRIRLAGRSTHYCPKCQHKSG